MPDPEPAPVKRCPECGVDMTDRDPKGHAEDHWPSRVKDEDLGDEAKIRRKRLLEM